MTEFETHEPGRGGWTEWVFPVMQKYLMRCCDCGLVHEMRFRVVKQTTRARKGGTWGRAEPAERGLRVAFRARREIPQRSAPAVPTGVATTPQGETCAVCGGSRTLAALAGEVRRACFCTTRDRE